MLELLLLQLLRFLPPLHLSFLGRGTVCKEARRVKFPYRTRGPGVDPEKKAQSHKLTHPSGFADAAPLLPNWGILGRHTSPMRGARRTDVAEM